MQGFKAERLLLFVVLIRPCSKPVQALLTPRFVEGNAWHQDPRGVDPVALGAVGGYGYVARAEELGKDLNGAILGGEGLGPCVVW